MSRVFPARKSEKQGVQGRYGFPGPETFEPVEPELLNDLFAWVMVDPTTNREGVITTKEGMPVFGDQARVESLRELAKLTAQLYGQPAKLVRWHRGEAVDVVTA